MKAAVTAVGAVLLVGVLALGMALAVALGRDETPAGMVCSPPGQTRETGVAGYAGVQLDNAAAIVATGRERGLPQEAWVIAVATAMAESTLRVVEHGDSWGPDSRGLFQQRDSWGPLEVRMDPAGSAGLFYDRLVALTGPTWDANPALTSQNNPAQRVQRSRYPLRYAEFDQPARAVVGAVIGAQCTPGGGAGGANPHAHVVIERALSQLGTPYAWGGGTAAGASLGTDGVVGFDCSGLALYAYAAAGVAVPHQTQSIWSAFQPAITDRTQVAPGDLILLSSTGAPEGIHHVGIYLGDGRVVEAPQSGQTVQIREDVWRPGGYYDAEFIGAVRPGQ